MIFAWRQIIYEFVSCFIIQPPTHQTQSNQIPAVPRLQIAITVQLLKQSEDAQIVLTLEPLDLAIAQDQRAAFAAQLFQRSTRGGLC
ncbi:hypothetical protein MACH23_19110 [Sulfitobacter pontiacus]|nr:hypothetical protein MACH23_19110 [Sulfitobacter pontiacus]